MSDERTKPYTTAELAAAAGVSNRYVRRLVSSGKLAGELYANVWLVPADVGRAWLQEREEKERAERARWEKY